MGRALDLERKSSLLTTEAGWAILIPWENMMDIKEFETRVQALAGIAVNEQLPLEDVVDILDNVRLAVHTIHMDKVRGLIPINNPDDVKKILLT